MISPVSQNQYGRSQPVWLILERSLTQNTHSMTIREQNIDIAEPVVSLTQLLKKTKFILKLHHKKKIKSTIQIIRAD